MIEYIDRIPIKEEEKEVNDDEDNEDEEIDQVIND